MLPDHLHGNRLPKHPAVRRHPEGGVPHKGDRSHVSLPAHIHHHAVRRGPSAGAVLQMFPNTKGTSWGQRPQLPVCFWGVSEAARNGGSFNTTAGRLSSSYSKAVKTDVSVTGKQWRHEEAVVHDAQQHHISSRTGKYSQLGKYFHQSQDAAKKIWRLNFSIALWYNLTIYNIIVRRVNEHYPVFVWNIKCWALLMCLCTVWDVRFVCNNVNW